jgi:hypothetical protein
MATIIAGTRLGAGKRTFGFSSVDSSSGFSIRLLPEGDWIECLQ